MLEKYLHTFREMEVSRKTNAARKRILEMLNSDKFSPLVHDYLATIHADGVPFTEFSHEPDLISQIKKLINALYHAEMASIDVETCDADEGIALKDLFVLGNLSRLNHTIEHTYKACSLATHFDIDLSEIFSNELAVFAPLYALFNEFTKSRSEETKALVSEINGQALMHQIGRVGGIVVDQMSPSSGEIDYEYLATFSADIPKYLDQLSSYIEGFSSSISTHQPTIDKNKLDELQDNALQLLKALDKTRGSSIFLPLKTLYYIRIIRHTITLSMSIFEQAGLLSDSSQDMARAKLAELKYQLLPAVFGFTDKIEEHAMLTPGLLSDPLMACVSRLYQSLIKYTNKFVCFSSTGQELMTIDDSRFVDARLEHIYKRSVEDHTMMTKLEEVKREASCFFLLLNKPQYQGLRIIDLPAEIKKQLAFHYKVIQPYILPFNIPLNNAIIEGLTSEKRAFDLTFTLLWLDGSTDTDSISNVLSLQKIVNDQLDKATASHELHLQLNNNLITSISERVDELRLFPHDVENNPYAINEANILKLELIAENKRLDKEPRPFTAAQAKIIANNKEAILRFEAIAAVNDRLIDLTHLTKSQILTLYKFYQMKSKKLARAEEAYDEFHSTVNTPWHSPLSALQKKKSRNLYGVIQPYLVSGLSFTVDTDKAIIEELATNDPVHGIKTTSIFAFAEQIKARFRSAKDRLDERLDVFAELVKDGVRAEYQDKKLVPESAPNDRSCFVIKNTECSKAIAEFRQSLYQLTSLFNSSVRAQLQPASTGLPFPELEDVNKKLALSSQSLGLKRLFNCLYHLEEMSNSLEALNDHSMEPVYAYHVYCAGTHLHDLIFLVKDLAATPYLSVVAGNLWEKLQQSYATLMAVHKHYVPDPAEGGETDLVSNHSAVLFYTLNTLMVLPEHIIALRGEQPLTSTQINVLHRHTEKVTGKIEKILHDSDSSFKLFLQIPVMYQLFRELKVKLGELSTVSHDVVMDNLAVINDTLLTKMLLEADRWEDNFGLTPGGLSGPLKKMLDEFYQGLLQPLGLKSQEHVMLVASMVPIERRLDATRKRIEQAELEQRKIEEKREVLHRLVTRIKCYRTYDSTDPCYLPTLKALLIGDFKRALPILNELIPYLGRKDIPESEGIHQTLDILLNTNVKNEPPLINIEALAEAGLSYCQGLQASSLLTMNSAKEKTVYLNALKENQLRLKATFTENYTKASFKKQAAALAAKQVGLIHCNREYNQKLAEYMQRGEAGIVLAAKIADDIDNKIGRLLWVKARQFEQENYQSYYHLETIMAAIARLEQYIYKSNIAIQDKHFTFEDSDTINHKSELVGRLKDIALTTSLPINERLVQMKAFVTLPTFETRITACHDDDSFTLAWLMQWVMSILDLIGLYIPEHKKCYNQLLKSVEPPLEGIGQLSARFGLFSANSPGRAYDVTVGVSDQPPQPLLA